MLGRILGNRYELIERIGGGGMALVYKAKCKLLNRYVAIKILRPEFTEDEEFVKRFRIEAQAAASLSHPNIVPIYDVGNDGEIHYIVMEYINGITLKEYISSKGSLNWKEALNIAIQICSAIEHAHRNHVVHRDIKPQNILLTDEKIAKVTDFGIARAVSSSTITIAGSTIGSVHYFSPEQARGGFTDEKSDLYSLGIVLYEMVTGQLPFDGETPVAVALKHIQDQAPEPIDINGRVPGAVNDIIVKAIKKEQNMRYPTATEMLDDLYMALKDPNGDFVRFQVENDSPTKRMDAIGDRMLAREEGNYIRKSKSGQSELKEKKKDRIAVLFAILTSVILIGISTYIGFKFVMETVLPQKEPEFVVGNYIGKDIYAVRQELDGKLNVKEKRVFDNENKKDIVIDQSLPEGRKIQPGEFTEIELTVSDGPPLVKIPDFTTREYRDAELQLKDLKLETEVIEENSEDIASGLVIRTVPGPDEMVEIGTKVTIYRSIGPLVKQSKVPNLIGKTRAEAQQLLEKSNLKIGILHPEDKVSDIAKITKQSPEPDQIVDEGTAVDLFFETEEEPGDTEEQPGDETPSTNDDLAYIATRIKLPQDGNYGDTIKVLVVVIPSNTGEAKTIVNDFRAKSDFPLNISIPVPKGGNTIVKVFLDDEEKMNFVKEY